jgi:hypothetical protein
LVVQDLGLPRRQATRDRIVNVDKRKAIEMSTSHCCRKAVSAVAAAFIFALYVPAGGSAEDQIVADEQILSVEGQIPVLAPSVASWDEASGYGSVEASRAIALVAPGPVAGPAWDATSGYGAVEANRASIAQETWDERSGYGAVETSRAIITIAAPAGLTSLVPSDVRWAPAPTGFTSLVPSDVRWAPAYALSRQMNPQMTAAKAWEESSGYASVEASRADGLARVLAMGSVLDCNRGAEYQETPSCSAVSAPASQHDSP